MSHHENHTELSGSVTDVFAHRFVIETGSGKILADLGPKGAARIALQTGDRVELSGEMKPSELKVSRITRNGEAIDIHHPPKRHDDHPEQTDPSVAMKALQAAGFMAVGEPLRKPKHIEVRCRNGDGRLYDIHVSLDGDIRSIKPSGNG